MKRILLALTLFVLLTASSYAATLEYYLSGAWYDTKVESHRLRGAGELRIWIYTDKTVHAEFFFNGNLLQTGTGTYADTGNLYRKKITIIAQGGQIMKGTLDTFGDGFVSGSYKGGGDTGKWQAIRPN